MTENLDAGIARVSFELSRLREQKLKELKRAIRQLENAGGPGSPSLKPTQQETRELLGKAVAEAGETGISARRAAEVTCIPYTRVRLLMPKLFQRTGSGRDTLYTLKDKN